MESKKWYLSKTFWVNLVMAAAMVVAMFSPSAAEFMRKYFSEVGLAWSAVNMVLRLVSHGKIELS